MFFLLLNFLSFKAPGRDLDYDLYPYSDLRYPIILSADPEHAMLWLCSIRDPGSRDYAGLETIKLRSSVGRQNEREYSIQLLQF